MTLATLETKIETTLTPALLAGWVQELVKRAGIDNATTVNLASHPTLAPYLYIHTPTSCTLVEQDEDWKAAVKTNEAETSLKLSFLDITRSQNHVTT